MVLRVSVSTWERSSKIAGFATLASVKSDLWPDDFLVVRVLKLRAGMHSGKEHHECMGLGT